MNTFLRRILKTVTVCVVAICTMSSVAFAAEPAGSPTYPLNEKGFINWMLDTKELSKLERQDLERAMKVITDAEEESFTHWAGGKDVHLSDTRNDKIADLSDINDALNLRNMVEGITVMKRINQLRQEDQNFTSLNPESGYTNFFFMAVAATGAVRGAGLERHSLLQVSCEDLSFGLMDPVQNWLRERYYFNKAKEQLGITEITSMDQMKEIKTKASSNGDTVGHYTNLFWAVEQVMGVGYTPYSRTFCFNASKKLNYTNDEYNRGQHMYTVEEFETLMKQFCKAVDVHDYDEGTVTKEPTCSKKGILKYRCRICGTGYAKGIPATGHEWDDGKVTVDPTLESEGVMTYSCKHCGESREEIIDRLTEAPLEEDNNCEDEITDTQTDNRETDVPVVTKPRRKIVRGSKHKVNGNTYKVIVRATASSKGKVAFVKAKNARVITVPDKVRLSDGKLYKVNKIAKRAFAASKATKVIMNARGLRKASVKGSLKGSRVRVIRVRVGGKKMNRNTVLRYMIVFGRYNAGRKVSVK